MTQMVHQSPFRYSWHFKLLQSMILCFLFADSTFVSGTRDGLERQRELVNLDPTFFPTYLPCAHMKGQMVSDNCEINRVHCSTSNVSLNMIAPTVVVRPQRMLSTVQHTSTGLRIDQVKKLPRTPSKSCRPVVP